MKIWYIHPYAGGPGLGRSWRSYYLARAWVSQGHDVIVITSGYHHLMSDRSKKFGKQIIEDIQYCFLPTNKYKGNGVGRSVSMLFFSISLFFWGAINAFKNKPDVIIYSSAHPLGFVSAWIAKKLSGAKLIFEVRDLWPLSLIEIAGYKSSHPFVRLLTTLEQFAYKTSDKVVSLLPGAKQYMMTKGMHETKFIYASNGFTNQPTMVDSAAYQCTLLEDIDELEKKGTFIYFYAGAFGEPNAMHKFVDALEVFDSMRPDNVRFVLVGKGEQFDEIRSRCESSGFDYVMFYSQVDKQAIELALKKVNVAFFVMHDLPIYRFGISLNKLFDYMAASIPVVGAYRSFNDPIREAGCGISVIPDSPQELAESFAAIYSWPVEARRVAGEKGRRYLEENFEYSLLAERIIASVQS